MRAGRGRDRNAMQRAAIDIGSVGAKERSNGLAGVRGVVFRNRRQGWVRNGQHRRVVGAGDGDLNRAVDDAAVAVVERNRELLDLGLVLREILDSGSRDA